MVMCKVKHETNVARVWG